MAWAMRGGIDLILLDIQLGGISGVEVLHRLSRELPHPPSVLVISSARDHITVRQALSARVVGYLVKPFSRATLHDRLRVFRTGFRESPTDTHDRPLAQSEIDRMLGPGRGGGGVGGASAERAQVPPESPGSTRGTRPGAPPGAHGAPESADPHGTAGVAGAPGATGATGVPGAPGAPGAAGAPGVPGSHGPSGLPGAAGGSGSPDAPGLPGAAGGSGSPDASGLPGAAGSRGATGSPEAPGSRGSAHGARPGVPSSGVQGDVPGIPPGALPGGAPGGAPGAEPGVPSGVPGVPSGTEPGVPSGVPSGAEYGVPGSWPGPTVVAPRSSPRLPKGLAVPTLRRVMAGLDSVTATSVAELAERCEISRPTARRYLEFLVTQGAVDVAHRYGRRGRPEVLYRLAAAR